jgi:hypothetical protein
VDPLSFNSAISTSNSLCTGGYLRQNPTLRRETNRALKSIREENRKEINQGTKVHRVLSQERKRNQGSYIAKKRTPRKKKGKRGNYLSAGKEHFEEYTTK